MNTDTHLANMHRQKERVAFDMKELVASTEALLRSTASYTGAEIEEARERLRRQLETAKEEGNRWNTLAREKVQHASAVTDEYVHEHPWRLLGLVAIAGAIAGHCLLGNRER